MTGSKQGILWRCGLFLKIRVLDKIAKWSYWSCFSNVLIVIDFDGPIILSHSHVILASNRNWQSHLLLFLLQQGDWAFLFPLLFKSNLILQCFRILDSATWYQYMKSWKLSSDQLWCSITTCSKLLSALLSLGIPFTGNCTQIRLGFDTFCRHRLRQ